MDVPVDLDPFILLWLVGRELLALIRRQRIKAKLELSMRTMDDQAAGELGDEITPAELVDLE